MLKTVQYPIMPGMDHPLTRWRHQHEKTQVELSQLSGIRQGTLARYESGTRIPRKAHLLTLMQVTGLPLEALIFPDTYLQEHPDFLREPIRQPGLRKRPRGQGEG